MSLVVTSPSYCTRLTFTTLTSRTITTSSAPTAAMARKHDPRELSSRTIPLRTLGTVSPAEESGSQSTGDKHALREMIPKTPPQSALITPPPSTERPGPLMQFFAPTVDITPLPRLLSELTPTALSTLARTLTYFPDVGQIFRLWNHASLSPPLLQNSKRGETATKIFSTLRNTTPPGSTLVWNL